MEKTKLRGAIMTFIVLQMIYLFSFFITFPDSFRNAIGWHFDAAAMIAAWLSTLTMLGYCIMCLASVSMLVMRKPGFLLWFQISGATALVGNFIVFVLRQVSQDDFLSSYFYRDVDYYWVLFIMALFWTVTWCMYFARSSRVFSYMGEEDDYLRGALFTKKVKAPTPWADKAGHYAPYPPSQPYPPQGSPPPYARPTQGYSYSPPQPPYPAQAQRPYPGAQQPAHPPVPAAPYAPPPQAAPVPPPVAGQPSPYAQPVAPPAPDQPAPPPQAAPAPPPQAASPEEAGSQG